MQTKDDAPLAISDLGCSAERYAADWVDRRDFLRVAAGMGASGKLCGFTSLLQAASPVWVRKAVIVAFGGGARDEETFAPEGQENIPNLIKECGSRKCHRTLEDLESAISMSTFTSGSSRGTRHVTLLLSLENVGRSGRAFRSHQSDSSPIGCSSGRLGSSSGCARLAENVAAQPKINVSPTTFKVLTQPPKIC
jgi:hypothetical protein